MFHIKEGDSIILASESTRRIDILRTLGVSFAIIPPNVDESRRKNESARDYVRRISFEKAHKVGTHFPDKWVIGADTVVVLHGKILGKPAGDEEAFQMLRTLSDKWHRVVTGFCLLNISRDIIYRDAVETKVFLRNLSDEEIRRYIETSEPMGKAGSYAVQGKGGCMVREIKGSYTNVVGLPICQVVEALLSFGVLS